MQAIEPLHSKICSWCPGTCIVNRPQRTLREVVSDHTARISAQTLKGPREQDHCQWGATREGALGFPAGNPRFLRDTA